MDKELRCNQGNNSDCEPEDCNQCPHSPGPVMEPIRNEPTEQELVEHIHIYEHVKMSGQLTCIACEGTHTSFIRNGYWACHDCRIWFKTGDARENQHHDIPLTSLDQTIQNIGKLDQEANMWTQLAYELEH